MNAICTNRLTNVDAVIDYQSNIVRPTHRKKTPGHFFRFRGIKLAMRLDPHLQASDIPALQCSFKQLCELAGVRDIRRRYEVQAGAFALQISHAA